MKVTIETPVGSFDGPPPWKRASLTLNYATADFPCFFHAGS